MFEVNRDMLKLYRDYTYERANIYYKKEILKQLPPYTIDPILGTYKFTSHRRELDRESKFLIATVTGNDELSIEDKYLNCFLFRMFNTGRAVDGFSEWPIHFDSIKQGVDQEYWDNWKAKELLYKGVMQSNAYFLSHCRTAANRITKNGLAGYNGSLVEFTNTHRDTIIEAASLPPAECIAKLQTISSIGDFMSYQVWVDFTYIEGYHSSEGDYVVSGPGCDQGIDWLVGIGEPVEGVGPGIKLNKNGAKIVEYGSFRKAYPTKTYNEFIYWFRDNLQSLMNDAGLEWNPKEFQHFLPEKQQTWNLMNIENSMCEFNKLLKLRNGVSMRARYYYSPK